MASSRYQTETARWAAVCARDPAADGAFVYCVRTTKIYCRPTCKARLARRSNIEFFTEASDAVTSGYRACKRCKPDLETFVPEADRSIERIRLSLENLPQDAPLPKLEVMAAEAGLTKYHFHRCFKKATGQTPREYALGRRQSRQIVADTTQEIVSETSTPSLVFDSAPSGAMSTPASADFSFDDWLADGTGEPLLIENYFDDFVSRPEDLGVTLSEASQNVSAFDEAFKALPTYEINYVTVETTGGVLLMAFQDQQICKLELFSTLYEAMSSLEASFPTGMYVHHAAEMLPDAQRITLQMRVAAVVVALEEHPLGDGATPAPNWLSQNT